MAIKHPAYQFNLPTMDLVQRYIEVTTVRQNITMAVIFYRTQMVFLFLQIIPLRESSSKEEKHEAELEVVSASLNTEYLPWVNAKAAVIKFVWYTLTANTAIYGVVAMNIVSEFIL